MAVPHEPPRAPNTSAPSSNRACGFPAHGSPITFGRRHARGSPRLARRPSRHRGVPPDTRGASLAAIPSRASHQRRGESAAPSLGGGSVVLCLQAVLWAAPTAWAARRRLRRSPSTPRLDSCGPLARLSRGAPWGCPRLPSLLPRRAPAAVVGTRAPVFLPGQRSRRPRAVNGATPGFAARYGLRGCALPSASACQGTRCFRLPVAPPSSYPGALPAPGAGLPPASPMVSMAYCPVTFFPQEPPGRTLPGQKTLPPGAGPG